MQQQQGAGGGASAGAGALGFLRNNPQFQAFRQIVQTNPSILQPMLQVRLLSCSTQSLSIWQATQSQQVSWVETPCI